MTVKFKNGPDAPKAARASAVKAVVKRGDKALVDA